MPWLSMPRRSANEHRSAGDRSASSAGMPTATERARHEAPAFRGGEAAHPVFGLGHTLSPFIVAAKYRGIAEAGHGP